MRRQKNALPKGTLTVRIYAVHRDRIKRLKNLLNDGSPQVVEALDTLLEDPERCAKLIKSPDQIAANVTRSQAAKVKTLSAKVDSLENFVRQRPRTEDGKPTSAGQPTVKVKRFRPPKCEARILAEDLLKERKPDGGVLTRAEIEQRIVDTLRVSRNSAQSAATKAVQQERPFNPARITRRRPGISCVDTRRSEEQTSELQSLMRISYDVFCLIKIKDITLIINHTA